MNLWRRSGLVVSAFASGSCGLGSSPGQGHSVVSVPGQITVSLSASLHTGV